MKYHTFTPEEFLLFEQAVQDFMQKLEITGWELELRQEQVGGGICAELDYNIVARKALMRLTVNVEYDYAIITDIVKLAKHEVLHLLLADFCWTAAEQRDHCSDAVISREHEVINRLMKVCHE